METIETLTIAPSISAISSETANKTDGHVRSALTDVIDESYSVGQKAGQSAVRSGFWGGSAADYCDDMLCIVDDSVFPLLAEFVYASKDAYVSGYRSAIPDADSKYGYWETVERLLGRVNWDSVCGLRV